MEKVFKNKLVLKIPTQIFASYNVGALITFVEESIKNKEKKYDSTVEPLASMMEIKTKKNILAVSINANGENSHISYRLYNNLQEIVLDSNIINIINQINFLFISLLQQFLKLMISTLNNPRINVSFNHHSW